MFEDPDLICLGETHLTTEQEIDVDGYKYYRNARQTMGKPSGGVAILVKDSVFDNYSVSCCTADTEGILGLMLKHLKTDYESVVVCNYLPPATSNYGKDPESFYGRLLQLTYEMCEVDFLMFCGDFNSRIGTHRDTTCDNIPDRLVLDETVNSHDRSLLEFLNDSYTYVLNGRFGSVSYTCHKYNGSSMVDFCLVPVEHFNKVLRFSTHALEALLHDLAIEHLIFDGSALPDHDLIHVEFASSGTCAEQFVRGLGVSRLRRDQATRKNVVVSCSV